MGIDQRIIDILTERGIKGKQIVDYLNDIVSFSDLELYIDLSDEEIWIDFNQYLAK
jgi:hypothetical protein